MISITQDKSTKIPGGTSLYLRFDYTPQIVDIIKQCPVYSYDKNTHIWEAPCTSLAFLLDSLCSLDGINLNLLNENNVSEPEFFDLGPYKTIPFNYQLDGIQYGLNHDKWLLLDMPGLGKSLQLIYLAQELYKRHEIEHCLIVCGVNALKANWKKEIEIHSDLSAHILGEKKNKKGQYINGSLKERLEDAKTPINEFFVITNIQTLREDAIVKELNSGKANKFDMIIFDECHTAKSPTAAQTKGLMKLKNAKYKVAATGTLLLNNPIDAYVPLKWIEKENCTFSNFKYYYCNYTGQFHNILLGFRNIDVLKQQIEQCSLRRTKDLLSLPEKTIINEYLDMEDDQKKFYENIKNGIKDQVDKVDLKTATILSLVTRLRQATACPSILTTEMISSAKIDRCCELVNQIVSSGEKVVVFSTFKNTLDSIYEKLRAHNPTINTGDVADEEISRNVDDFQTTDNSKVFLCTWQRMGVGITLTKASYAIFLDTPWTAAVYQQAQDRIHRIGSKQPVFIYNLICKDTIDERVLSIVEDKEAIADYIIDDKITTKSMDSLRKYIEELFQT